MHCRSANNTIAACCLLVSFAVPAAAQRVLGPGEDATVVPRGYWRFGTLADWTSYDQRYGKAATGSSSGTLGPLGADLTVDSLGVGELPSLAALQTNLRALSAIPTYGVSLGNSVLKLEDRVNSLPFVLEFGVAKRLSLSIHVPYVTTRANVFWNVNTAGTNGNIGFNPIFFTATATSTLTQDTALVNQFVRASSALAASLAACLGQTTSQCSSLNANRSTAQALVTSSSAFAEGMSNLISSLLVPIKSTDAQTAIEARVAAFKAAYQSFGINQISGTGLVPAATRLGLSGLQTIMTDSAFGIAADPLQTINRSHFGDVTVGGKLALFDTFGPGLDGRMSPKGLNFRLSVGGAFTLPTSQIESPDNFVDIGTGRGARTLEGRIYTDLIFGRRFWQSAIVRYNHPSGDTQIMRIGGAPGIQLAPLYARQTINRQLGNAIEMETSSRFVVNDFFAISGQFIHRHKAQDHYTGSFTIPAAVTGSTDVSLDASLLDLDTEMTENRVGGGIAFSNLYAFQQGNARLPYEVTFLHQQTISGAGNQPKYFVDQIQIRLYTRIFGASARGTGIK
jgi:hypothetical protein